MIKEMRKSVNSQSETLSIVENLKESVLILDENQVRFINENFIKLIYGLSKDTVQSMNIKVKDKIADEKRYSLLKYLK